MVAAPGKPAWGVHPPRILVSGRKDAERGAGFERGTSGGGHRTGEGGAELFALIEGAKLVLGLAVMSAVRGFLKRTVQQLALSNQRLVRTIQMSFQSL